MNANAYLRGSPNYVWCTTSVLGKGATGAVYQGVDKNNGEPVAVKTFNTVSQFRPHDVQIREFEVLKKVFFSINFLILFIYIITYLY